MTIRSEEENRNWICYTCDILIESVDIRALTKHQSHDLKLDTLSPEEKQQFILRHMGKERRNLPVHEEMALLTYDEYQEKLSSERTNLQRIVNAHFPNKFPVLEICLSVKAQLMIEKITQVFALVLLGAPSTYKSTMLEIVASLADSYVSDSFTPKSFVSHSANTSKDKLGQVDLLPRIRHKTLITAELAPLFSGNPDQLVEYFGMLTRILDGRGYMSDSGVHGQRGYEGDYSFMWLGAVVDIPHRVWKVLGNLGPKMYFLRIPSDQREWNEKKEIIKQSILENDYTFKVGACKKAIGKFWNLISGIPTGKVNWDSERDDPETFSRIIDIAQTLAKLRASVPTWHTNESDSTGSNYHYEMPVIEDPARAASALYNLARGHAVLYGRNYIKKDDLQVVIAVALSSASRERVELFKLLLDHNGKLNTEEFSKFTQVSKPTALKEMKMLQILDLVDEFAEAGQTKPTFAIKLKPELEWFQSEEFRGYWTGINALLNPENSLLSFTKKEENKEKKDVSEITQVIDNTDDNVRFICETCNAGPFGILEKSTSGNILKFHQKLGHEIKFLEVQNP